MESAKHQWRCAPMDAGIISSRAENHGLTGRRHGVERSDVDGLSGLIGRRRTERTSEGMRPGRPPQMDIPLHAIVRYHEPEPFTRPIPLPAYGTTTRTRPLLPVRASMARMETRSFGGRAST